VGFENSRNSVLAKQDSPEVEISQELTTTFSDSQRTQLKQEEWPSQGIVERLVFAALSPRDKQFAELLLARKLQYTKTLLLGAALGLIGAAVLLSRIAPDAFVFWPIFISIAVGAPLMGGSWVGFEGPMFAGIQLPIYAQYPVSYWTLSIAMLKILWIRLILFAPVALIYAVAWAWASSGEPMLGLSIGIQVFLLLLAAQPLLIALKFSNSSNDTRGFTRVSAALSGLIFVFLLSLVGVAILVFGFPTPFFRVLSFICLFMVTITFWAAYGWVYNHLGFDLLRSPRA
jgi:hypothetical protein